ncbi:MAG TPA: hypothetical protein VHR86_10115 [Armatimonadota bacterium]|nr:hypothetical protein [Armatimonadota bacterium]
MLLREQREQRGAQNHAAATTHVIPSVRREGGKPFPASVAAGRMGRNVIALDLVLVVEHGVGR